MATIPKTGNKLICEYTNSLDQKSTLKFDYIYSVADLFNDTLKAAEVDNWARNLQNLTYSTYSNLTLITSKVLDGD